MLINYYNKSEINEKNTTQFNILIDKIKLKSDKTTTYNKSEINNLVSKYAELINTYSKADINSKNLITLIDLASNLNHYYTKDILDSLQIVGQPKLDAEFKKK